MVDVWRRDNNRAARPQHSSTLSDESELILEVFNAFARQNVIESLISKGQVEVGIGTDLRGAIS